MDEPPPGEHPRPGGPVKSDHRFGFVACLGRTNVGKSTLMNRLLGQKVGIVSRKPQTTRRRLRGILNLPSAQVVLVDTPGLHGPGNSLSRSFEREAREGVGGSDVVLAITDHLGAGSPEGEERLLDIVGSSRRPSLLVLNKSDLVTPERLGGMLDHYRRWGVFKRVLAASARKGHNMQQVAEAMVELLPPGRALYPRDIISDQPERDFFGEILREKIFRHMHQELPYSAAVVVEDVKEEERSGLYRVGAVIYVERESQKGMLIGGGGKVLRRIGTAARMDMEKLTGEKVYLSLWVKVRKNWSRDPKSLREFGFE